MEKEQVIKSLMEAGAEPVKNLKVKNVIVTPRDTYVQVSLSLDKAVKGMVQDEDGNWVEGETKVIYTSTFALASILRDNDDCAGVVNHLLEHPEAFQIILSRATINILIEKVIKGEVYKNPWSDSDKTTVVQNDSFYCHITSIKLTDKAVGRIEDIENKILGI